MTCVLLAVAADDQRPSLADQLLADEYRVAEAANYGEAMLAAQTDFISAAIIDLGLPNHGALRLLRETRAGTHHDLAPDLPVVGLLPNDADELQLARAYAAGVDDVARQPVGYVELRCRVQSLLHRAQPVRAQGRRRRILDVEIDLAARSVTQDEREIELTRLEFDLLVVLSSDPRRVFTKHDLLKEIWGMPGGVRTRTLDSHACRLRKKLSSANGAFVTNRWGIGYSLLPPS
jgi:DNA-binding response OmpR family regulator